MSLTPANSKDSALSAMEVEPQAATRSLPHHAASMDCFDALDGLSTAESMKAIEQIQWAEANAADAWPGRRSSVTWDPIAHMLKFLTRTTNTPACHDDETTHQAVAPIITLLTTMAQWQWKISLAVVLTGASLLGSMHSFIQLRVPTVCLDSSLHFVSQTVYVNAYFCALYFLIFSKRGAVFHPASAAALPREVFRSRSAAVVAIYEFVALCRLVSLMPFSKQAVDTYRMCTDPRNDPVPISLPTYAAIVLTLHAAAVVTIISAVAGFAHQQGTLQELRKPEFYSNLRYKVNEEIVNFSVSKLTRRAARCVGFPSPPPAVADSSSNSTPLVTSVASVSKCPFASFASLGALCPHALPAAAPAESSPAVTAPAQLPKEMPKEASSDIPASVSPTVLHTPVPAAKSSPLLTPLAAPPVASPAKAKSPDSDDFVLVEKE